VVYRVSSALRCVPGTEGVGKIESPAGFLDPILPFSGSRTSDFQNFEGERTLTAVPHPSFFHDFHAPPKRSFPFSDQGELCVLLALESEGRRYSLPAPRPGFFFSSFSLFLSPDWYSSYLRLLGGMDNLLGNEFVFPGDYSFKRRGAVQVLEGPPICLFASF